MTLGPGKYDAHCTRVREELQAEGVVMIVVKGKEGHGVSVQADITTHLALPKMLRILADSMEKKLRRTVEKVAKEHIDKHAFARCPECNTGFVAMIKNGATPTEMPKAGEHTVCPACGGFLVFVGERELRLMTEDEVIALPDNERNEMTRVRRIFAEMRAQRESEE